MYYMSRLYFRTGRMFRMRKNILRQLYEGIREKKKRMSSMQRILETKKIGSLDLQKRNKST